jgi:hypothetical protein
VSARHVDATTAGEQENLSRAANVSNLTPTDSITAVVVNYRTPDLVAQAVGSFRRFYPTVPVVIIDNGSGGGSRKVIERLVGEAPLIVSSAYLDENIFHGPAMDLGMTASDREAVLFLDSDTRTERHGFLEQMLEMLVESDRVFAVGKTALVNKRGFVSKNGVPVPLSAYMLVRRSLYLQLPPFEHHGLPVLKSCREAAARGLEIRDFPVDEYIEHFGRGTAGEFGYGLGLRSRIDFLLNRLGL